METKEGWKILILLEFPILMSTKLPSSTYHGKGTFVSTCFVNFKKPANRFQCTQNPQTGFSVPNPSLQLCTLIIIKKYLLSSSVPGKTLESSSDADFCLRKSLDFGVHFPASIWQSGWTFIRHNLHFNPCRVWPKINIKKNCESRNKFLWRFFDLKIPLACGCFFRVKIPIFVPKIHKRRFS